MLNFIPRILRAYAFPILLLLLPLAAMAFPQPGARGGVLRPEWTVPAALFVVFFCSGLTLRTETVLAGLANWRVHGFVHGFLFVVSPVLAVGLLALAGDGLDADLRMGVFYLAALPCTIATAVVYTTNAGGNHTAALFNATVTNLLGVILVPLLVATQVSTGRMDPEVVGGMIRNTAVMVFPPIVIGQLVRPVVKVWVERHRKLPARVSSAMILLLTYLAFCQTFDDGVLARVPALEILTAGGIALLLMAVVMAVAVVGIRILRFDRGDAIAAFFCSTLKTLGAGIPLAPVVFRGTDVEVGVVILPLMVYFLVSLVLGSIIVQRLRAG